MNGFVKLNRKILENAVFSDGNFLRLWIYILCRAAYRTKDVIFDGNIVHLERGQLITGRKRLASELGMNENKVYSMLKKLERLGSVSIDARNKFSVLTVVNWDRYQLEEEELSSDEPKSVSLTACEQEKDTVREAHGIYGNVFLTEEEYNTLKSDFWEVDSKIDKLSAYIMKTGHKYPSHCATLRLWLEKDGMKRNEGFDRDFDPDEYLRLALQKSMGE